MGAVGDEIELLERVVYSVHQVDRLLDLPGGTALRWIDGYERRGREYPPVVRQRSTGSDLVTWGEFVETRLLAEYREHGALMVHMRPVVDQLRKELGTKYPLAIVKPWVQGRELVRDVQEKLGLDERLHLVVVIRTGQTVLAPPSQRFHDSIDWEDGAAARIRPGGANDPVVFDPLRSFGEPVVDGTRTDVLAEEVRAGDSIESVAQGFGLTTDQVRAAVRYEESMAAA